MPPRPRDPVPRERDVVPRDRDPLLRLGFAAPADAGFAAEPDDALRAPLERLEPEPDELARAEADLRLLPAADEPLDLRELPDFFAPLARDEVDEAELVPALALPSIVHLPLITRWAASATASAIREPSLVALATTLLAAWLAVSAASRPASRIARRALGLALIAAAAAASPAASISLLIAALASLSTVSLLDEEPDEPVLPEDFAIASSP